MVYSTPYDPTKPIFTVSSTNPTTPTNTPATISISNLVGKWSIKSLFNIPFPNSPYSLTFTSQQIILNGGCNKYSYQYTLNSPMQLIQIGNLTATNNSNCGQSDDQLYVNGIMNMYKYLLSSTNGVYTLSFYNSTGSMAYQLQINVQPTSAPQTVAQYNPKAVTPSPGTSSTAPASTASVPSSLTPGTYLLLILQRRDLPRLIVNVTATTLSYKGCNSILQTYKISNVNPSNSSITITGAPISNNTCNPNNDLIYYNALNQAKTFYYDSNARAAILSDSTGVQTVTLSFAS